MKRLLSLLLAMTMVISMIPSVFAQEEIADIVENQTEETTAIPEETVEPAVEERAAIPEMPAAPVEQETYAATEGDYTYTVSNGEATITGYTGDGGDVDIPSNLGGYPVVAIGVGAFYDCNLAAVDIPNGVTTIGGSAFACNHYLMVVNIPASVISINLSALDECEKLSYLDVDEGNPAYSSDDEGVLFNGDKSTLLRAPRGICEDYTIPDSVTTIGDKAFYSCDSLTSVTIGNSVTTIGDDAFDGCYRLTNVYYTGTQEQWNAVSIGSGNIRLTNATIHYAKHSHEHIAVVTAPTCTAAGYTTYTCACGDSYVTDEVAALGHTEKILPAVATTASSTGLTEGKKCSACGEILVAQKIVPVVRPYAYIVSNGEATITDYTGNDSNLTIPSTLGGYPVTTIGKEAFSEGYSLISVVIPDSVTTIVGAAFEFCHELTSVTLPNSVTTIGNDAFYLCDKITDVYYDGNEEQWNRVVIGQGNEYLCNAKIYMEGKQYNQLGYTYTLENWEATVVGYTGTGGDIAIPAALDGFSVIGIDEFAFSGCDSLTSVTIPDSVKTIGASAFEDCINLSSVSLGNGVTAIGDTAFAFCSSLTSVTIPDSITTIGMAAFYECTGLASVTIPYTVTAIGDGAFCGCYSLADVYYDGTEGRWNAIAIGIDNEYLLDANIHLIKFEITAQPTDQHNKLGDTATFTVEAEGAASYQWQRLKKGSAYWTNISGATDASYSVKVSSSAVLPYRCVLTDSSGNQLITNEVTIILPEPLVTVTNTAGNQHVIKNSAISFTVELDSTEGVTYQWQRCKSGNNWTDVSYTGNQTKTVTFSAASWAQYPFRCEITDANGTKIYTDTYTYTLVEPPVTPAITANPKDIYVLTGGTATFTVEAVGSDLTYQWWRSRDGGETWGEYNGTGSKTSSISIKIYSNQEYLYMCEVKDGYGNTMKTKVVQPHLITAVKITSQPTVTVENGAATITFTATGDIKTYQWQRLKNGVWSDAVGANYVGYNTATLTTTVKSTYRCRITDLAGNVTYTNQVTFS